MMKRGQQRKIQQKRTYMKNREQKELSLVTDLLKFLKEIQKCDIVELNDIMITRETKVIQR